MGASEQGIAEPIKAAEVRTHSDMYKGIGVDDSDPYEQFRKNRGNVFIQKLINRETNQPKTKRSGMYQLNYDGTHMTGVILRYILFLYRS